MTDKELRKLNRAELLDILVAQSKKIQQLQKQLEETNARLESQELVISEAGSIAEASLRLSGIFEAAQQAADRYLYNVRHIQERCDRMEAESKAKAEQLLAQTQAKCHEMLSQAGLWEPLNSIPNPDKTGGE